MGKHTNKLKHTKIKNIFYSFFYSMQGLRTVFLQEPAFRQEVFLAVILSIVAWYFAESKAEFLFLEATLLFVMLVELLNSSLEKFTDLVKPEFHKSAKAIKDMGSAAVFLAFLVVILVWCAILLF